LNARLPLLRSCVAAVELSVWLYSGAPPSSKSASCSPSESAASDSDRHGVAQLQFENGSAVWQSMCGYGTPASVTQSSVAHVKSSCDASPGRCSCAKKSSFSGPHRARHARTRRWSVRSWPGSYLPGKRATRSSKIVFARSVGDSASRRSISGQSPSNASGCVRHVRSVTPSLGSSPVST
jgi:hypothetical protein